TAQRRGATHPEGRLAASGPVHRDGPGATTVRFTLVAPRAARVAVVGDFNHWDPARTPMRRAADGSRWEITVPLAPGRYDYSFVVDGVLATDPSAPRAPDADFGAPNSIVFVRGS
ncbi:MAG TPA: isoamylase early set domain-containing protein, partial [Gemmatimonadaceae bacterium]|nr:isoamylase early set domain-containing protein [Gemmatimonadaceae bacterium]